MREIRAAARGVLRVWWRRRRLAPCHATLDRSAPCAPSCRGRAVRGAQGHGAGRNGRAVLIHMDAVVAAASAGQLALGDHLLGGGGPVSVPAHACGNTRIAWEGSERTRRAEAANANASALWLLNTRPGRAGALWRVCVCVCVCMHARVYARPCAGYRSRRGRLTHLSAAHNGRAYAHPGHRGHPRLHGRLRVHDVRAQE